MGLFDIFNFKKKFLEIATPENIQAIRDVAKQKIIEMIKSKLSGIEKMDTVVEEVVAYISEHIHSDNKIVQWIIDNWLIPNVRVLTQAIYDDLKEVIKNL